MQSYSSGVHGQYASTMKAQDQWPPLEQVREWAAAKVVNGQAGPAATGKYTRLIVLIDEILASRTTTLLKPVDFTSGSPPSSEPTVDETQRPQQATGIREQMRHSRNPV
jgi:hypothetical protein